MLPLHESQQHIQPERLTAQPGPTPEHIPRPAIIKAFISVEVIGALTHQTNRLKDELLKG